MNISAKLINVNQSKRYINTIYRELGIESITLTWKVIWKESITHPQTILEFLVTQGCSGDSGGCSGEPKTSIPTAFNDTTSIDMPFINEIMSRSLPGEGRFVILVPESPLGDPTSPGGLCDHQSSGTTSVSAVQKSTENRPPGCSEDYLE